MTRSSNRLGWWALLALFLAVRVPFLLTWAPTVEEGRMLGTAALLVQRGPADVPGLREAPPLAAVLTQIPLSAFASDVLQTWDEESFEPVGASVLHGTRSLVDDELISPWLVLTLTRLPLLLLGFLGMEMLRRTAGRFFDARAGWIAAGFWALHPWLVGGGVLGSADGVAAVAGLFLLVSLIDYHDVSHRFGKLPGRRLVRLGIAAGLALLARHGMVLTVGLVALWSIVLRRARGARDEGNLPHPWTRFLVAGAIAMLVLWAGYRFELRPLAESHQPVPSAEIADLLGLDSEMVWEQATTVPVPAATYVQALLWKGLRIAGAGDRADVPTEDGGVGAAALITSPTAFLVLFLMGLGGWHVLRRDRADLPDLVALLAIVPVAAALTLAPPVRATHLIPALPFALVLGSAALSRLWESRPLVGRRLTAGLFVLLVLEWSPHLTDPLAFHNLPGSWAAHRAPHLPLHGAERGQDYWAVRDALDADVVRLEITFPVAYGLVERDLEQFPFLARDPSAWGDLAARVDAADQEAEGEARIVLAVAGQDLVHPPFEHLADVPPMMRVGNVHLFRVRPQE